MSPEHNEFRPLLVPFLLREEGRRQGLLGAAPEEPPASAGGWSEGGCCGVCRVLSRSMNRNKVPQRPWVLCCVQTPRAGPSPETCSLDGGRHRAGPGGLSAGVRVPQTGRGRSPQHSLRAQ